MIDARIPACLLAFLPDEACNHQNQISESDSMLRMTHKELSRTANGHRVPGMKLPRLRIGPRCARNALHWRTEAGKRCLDAGNRRK